MTPLPSETSGTVWAIVGLAFAGEINESNRPVYDGRLHVLLLHDPLRTKSVDLDDTTLPLGAWRTNDWDDVARMVNSLIRHDQRLYPPFNPLPAVVEGDRIVRLLVHEDDRDEDALVAKAAECYDLPTGTAR